MSNNIKANQVKKETQAKSRSVDLKLYGVGATEKNVSNISDIFNLSNGLYNVP